MKRNIFVHLAFSVSSSLQSFIHPGLLVTEGDITYARIKIAAGRAPWNSSYQELIGCASADASYSPSAVENIYRGSDGVHEENVALLWNDAAAAFALALRWKISGNDTYAETGANILRAWAGTLQAISGNDDAYLAAGFQGHEFANAGELLRGYEPFTKYGLDEFKSMMTRVFLPMNLAFLKHELSSQHNVKHFFANWELGNLASAMAIAVLTENTTVWDFGVDYFKTGEGNGCINNAVSNLILEPGSNVVHGQGQESGRDQGHSALDWQILGVIGQQAWNQGEDLFSYNNSRILQGAEYFARYNLGYDVEFVPYTNGIVSYDVISTKSRGATRPAWELLNSHYVQRKGMNAPWTTAYLNYTLEYYEGFEPGAGALGTTSGAYDSLGWGSLLYRRDNNDTMSPASPIHSPSFSSHAYQSSSSSPPNTMSPLGSSSSTKTSSIVSAKTSDSSHRYKCKRAVGKKEM